MINCLSCTGTAQITQFFQQSRVKCIDSNMSSFDIPENPCYILARAGKSGAGFPADKTMYFIIRKIGFAGMSSHGLKSISN